MSSKPFRPAREIAITARQRALHDPASYDPGPQPRRVLSIHDTQHADTLESAVPPRLRQRLFILAAYTGLVTAVLLLAARVQLLGPALVVFAVVTIAVTRLLFPPGVSGRHHHTRAAAGRAGTR